METEFILTKDAAVLDRFDSLDEARQAGYRLAMAPVMVPGDDEPIDLPRWMQDGEFEWFLEAGDGSTYRITEL